MFSPYVTNIIHIFRSHTNEWHKKVSHKVKDLKLTEYSSLDELQNIQQRKLRVLCETAFSGSPYYNKIFSQRDLDPQRIDISSLASLPVLNKRKIRENFDEVINKNYHAEKITKNATGGSSGEPLVFCQSRESRFAAAAFKLRGFEMCGKKQGFSHVKLWGAPTDVQKTSTGLKNNLWNYIYNLRTIDAFDAGSKLFDKEYEKFLDNPPYLLESYSNILYHFALYLKQHKRKPLSIPAVISSAGALYDFQRHIIQEMLTKNLFNRYGSREFGDMAHECDAHIGMHINMERFIIEIENPDRDGNGDILVTDLDNHAFPFIRYKIGDKGSLSNKSCSCGRQSVMFEKVIGRSLDIIRTKSGKLISGEMFPHFFKDYPEIIAGQVIQGTIDQIEIRLELVAGATSDELKALIDKIKQATNHELKININLDQKFITNPTGKYRPVISKINEQ